MSIKEEELKNRIREKLFNDRLKNNQLKYDSARILKNTDFYIAKPNRDTKQISLAGMKTDFVSYLWAKLKNEERNLGDKIAKKSTNMDF